MTKRRIWGDREPIAGADLTDIGSYAEQGLGDLALGFGPGILQGLGVQQTSTPSASVIVKAGKLLVQDPGVNRPRLLDLPADVALSLAGKSIGSYAIVVTALEAGEDTRTILPPPVGHPFYEAGNQSYQLATVQHWIASLSLQAMPYSPTGAQVILGTVNWTGASVQTADLTKLLDYPTPLVGDGGLLPVTLNAALAGTGLARSGLGVLSVKADGTVVTFNQVGQLTLADGGVNDTLIGPRSVTPLALPGTPGALGTLAANLGWLGQAIVLATGAGTWNAAPATTLSELNGSVARKARDEAIGGNWSFNAPLTIAAGSAPTHAVQKTYVDAAFGSASGTAAAALNAHKGAATLDHPDGSVTDAKLGARSVGEAASLPSSLTTPASLQGTLDWLGRVIRDIKGGAAWYAPAPNLLDLSTRLGAVELASGTVADGSITDARLGNRTVQDTLAPSSNTGSLTGLLSNLANRVKALTGEANWQVNPATSLSELHVNVARKGANESISGSWRFLASPTVPAPTAATHAATRAYVDGAVQGVSGTAADLTGHRTAGVIDHPDGSVTGAKLAATAVQDRLGYLPFNPAGGDLGAVRIMPGGEGLKLLPGSANWTAIGLYARDTSTRSGVLGYTSPGSLHLQLENDVANGDVVLTGGANGSVVLASPVFAAQNITATGEVIAHNGYGDTLSLGGVAGGNDYELRLSSANRPLNLFSPAGPITVTVSGTLNATNMSGGVLNLSGALAAQSLNLNGLSLTNQNGALKTGPVVADSLSVGSYPVWHAGNLDPAALANSGNVSAATILARLLTVDGPGSGLDADSLDGLNSADFARTVHTHTRAQISDFAHAHPVTDLPVAAPGESNAAKLLRSDDPRLSDARPPTVHTHTKSQISDFAHTHALSEVTGLQAALDGKASGSHTHAIPEVTGLQAALDGKAAVTHRHAWSEIDARPTSLSGYGITDGSVYDISGFVGGRPAQGGVALAFVAARPTTILAANPGSARVLTAPTAAASFSVQNEAGTQIGSVTFQAGSTNGSVALNSDVTLAANQLLILRSTGTRDATLADLAVTFRGRY